jgi:hypothetical protein
MVPNTIKIHMCGIERDKIGVPLKNSANIPSRNGEMG